MGGLRQKIEKAKSMVKQNGIVGGGKIISSYLKTYSKAFFVGAGDVLFITGGVGDKAHYRAFGPAEELAHHGFKCAVTVADNPNLPKYADKFKIFIFHKVNPGKKAEQLVTEIKKQKKEIIFDTDDLDFDPRYLKDMDYFSRIGPAERGEFEKGIGAWLLSDPYVKTATTTVSYLADKLKEKGKEVIIVPNKLSDKELALADEIISNTPKAQPLARQRLSLRKDGFIRLGYYSGTLSHNKDFATIADALIAILEKYEKVKLILAGPLDTEDKLNKFKDRIEVLPRVPREKYYENVYKCDINLAPLELGNPFCESRSEIKFIEAGVLKIPTVAVRNRTYSEAIADGADGFLAEDNSEWIEKIARLIEDENLRKSMGERAREKVLKNYTNKNSHNREYYEYIKSKTR
jgi:glycosyltransferase involved in cell wall biosynthesis